MRKSLLVLGTVGLFALTSCAGAGAKTVDGATWLADVQKTAESAATVREAYKTVTATGSVRMDLGDGLTDITINTTLPAEWDEMGFAGDLSDDELMELMMADTPDGYYSYFMSSIMLYLYGRLDDMSDYLASFGDDPSLKDVVYTVSSKEYSVSYGFVEDDEVDSMKWDKTSHVLTSVTSVVGEAKTEITYTWSK